MGYPSAVQLDCEPELPAAYKLKFYQHVDNLRLKAMQLGGQGAEEGTLMWTLTQEEALGRQGKPWICNPGDLHCALILRPEFEFDDYYQMLTVAVISLGNAIATYVSPMTALGYKWPNDITIADHKIASFWLDCGRDNMSPWLSITTSINIAVSPQTDEFNSMSIHEAEGSSDLTHVMLLESYAREFIKQINNWSERGFSYIFGQWQQRLEKVDRINQLHIGQDSTIEISGTVINQRGDIEFTNRNDGWKYLSIQEYMGITS